MFSLGQAEHGPLNKCAGRGHKSCAWTMCMCQEDSSTKVLLSLYALQSAVDIAP